MPKFMYIYHGGGRPETPEEGEKVMAAWMAWMQGMGEAVIDGGNPAGMSKTVSVDGVADNGGANPVSGYTLVNAPDIDAACEMAKGCPILEGGAGTIEVAEAMEM
ncbi:YciI family protein [Shimia sp.]|uniref:YciI family protein n=1 Tax=Shimia sp. TaxID=1954381 RepID=UPI00356AEC00